MLEHRLTCTCYVLLAVAGSWRDWEKRCLLVVVSLMLPHAYVASG